jgi:hypothetical protein
LSSKNLHYPKLTRLKQVTAGFRERGYRFADEALGDDEKISDVEFILGMSDPEVLLEEQVCFGSQASVFSKTFAGVLLCGSLTRMKSNLAHLPD